MQLRTAIEPFRSRRPIGLHDSMIVLGSCFSDHVGEWLRDSFLSVVANPFGVLFNPASIAHHLLDDQTLPMRILRGADGLFYSYDHHGSVCDVSEQGLRQTIVSLRQSFQQKLVQCDHVIVTFGTAWIYELEGSVVANCHKQPSSLFVRRSMSVDEIVELWRQVILRNGERKHWLFTVSPIRHVRDTLHGNQLSKATLLLAIDRLQQLFPDQVEYLPVYELLIDDLRDYRFYADDLVHPSSLAVSLVREFFAESCLDDECRRFIDDITPVVKALQHRPLHPDSEEHRRFVEQTKARCEALLSRYGIAAQDDSFRC